MLHTRAPLLALAIVASMTVFAFSAVAQQLALIPAAPDCPSAEPDSVQISRTAPCEEGNWLFDTQTGCRMWDWHPDMKDRAVWSGGSCPKGVKQGKSIVQWYEHGQLIDRFEGAYKDDVPHGPGTAILAGQTFSGQWKNGCMRKADSVVVVGVPRASCDLQLKVALNP